MTRDVDHGSSFPLGATEVGGGVNFSVYSKNASHVDVLLFDAVDAAQPARVFSLDRQQHRTYHYWHARPEVQEASLRIADYYQQRGIAGPELRQ